jgi:hypothetical protein
MAFDLNIFLVLVPYLLSKPITHGSNMVMIIFVFTHSQTASLQFHLTSGPVRLRPVWDQHHRSQAARTKDQTAGPVPNSAVTADQTDRGPDQRPVLRPVWDRTAGTLYATSRVKDGVRRWWFAEMAGTHAETQRVQRRGRALLLSAFN